MMQAWAAHVDDGIASLRTHKDISTFCQAI